MQSGNHRSRVIIVYLDSLVLSVLLLVIIIISGNTLCNLLLVIKKDASGKQQ